MSSKGLLAVIVTRLRVCLQCMMSAEPLGQPSLLDVDKVHACHLAKGKRRQAKESEV